MESGGKKMTELLSTFDAAKMVGISGQAVREAARRGEITPTHMTQGGRLLFTAEEISRWQAQRERRQETLRNLK